MRIKSVNKLGLKDVKLMMESLNINTNITGPNCDESYYLNVSLIDRYSKLYEIARNKPKVK